MIQLKGGKSLALITELITINHIGILLLKDG